MEWMPDAPFCWHVDRLAPAPLTAGVERRFSSMSESEHLTLVIALAVFEVVFASAGAFIAWRSGRSPVLWFFIGLIPIIGIFALLFFVEMPLRNSGAATTTGGQPTASGRKVMSAQERRVAFALICWLVLFVVAEDTIKMPKWLAVLLFFVGALVIFALFGSPPRNSTPHA